jgi:hypothetical protein
MAGAVGLKIEQQILRALADGPRNPIELKKALGWSIWGQNKALETLLQRMRVAGLVEPAGRGKSGLWQLRSGMAVCAHCQGRGVLGVAEEA